MVSRPCYESWAPKKNQKTGGKKKRGEQRAGCDIEPDMWRVIALIGSLRENKYGWLKNAKKKTERKFKEIS